jgi:hypothetical protein
MHVIACIKDPDVIRRILDHLSSRRQQPLCVNLPLDTTCLG